MPYPVAKTLDGGVCFTPDAAVLSRFAAEAGKRKFRRRGDNPRSDDYVSQAEYVDDVLAADREPVRQEVKPYVVSLKQYVLGAR